MCGKYHPPQDVSKTCIDETQFEISGLSLQGIFGSTKVDISSFLTIYTGKNTLDKTSALMKWFKDLRYRVFYGLFLNKNYKVISRGERSTGCAWNFCPDYLDSKSIIYGAGVGRDITFERTLVDEFGASVVLIDPSPTGA
ncbi:MAG TPA: hypothetical protein VFV23_04200, partial [Verrucomicrobiae bacterium]|nr:hypothetical protein [Verrucomicrobiae bacterium]